MGVLRCETRLRRSWVSKGTKVRTVRIDDALWDAAKAKAETRETSLSEVIRDYLQAWVSEDVDQR